MPELVAYSQPDAAAPVVSKFPATTYYGLPTTLLVTDQQTGWLKTLLPIQPNGTTGWVHDTDVTLSQTTMRMQISLSSRYLVLYDGATKILDTGVGIGKDQTPTPLGLFYVTDPVDLTTRPNGAYGAFALGLSGFSDVLKSFDGGPPQIAVHGDTVAADVGEKVSNGCIRVPNPAILEIAKRVPLGTPVSASSRFSGRLRRLRLLRLWTAEPAPPGDRRRRRSRRRSAPTPVPSTRPPALAGAAARSV